MVRMGHAIWWCFNAHDYRLPQLLGKLVVAVSVVPQQVRPKIILKIKTYKLENYEDMKKNLKFSFCNILLFLSHLRLFILGFFFAENNN